ncbi:hypothetical protein [Mycobacteroides abscessus]|uniref:hypothetical protein n=1 Tax=Mycobacteroides abscessus TaxID=36809 RepID=UPI000C2570B0|nr:hypothetical protein [Mycobacteroides abscessus]
MSKLVELVSATLRKNLAARTTWDEPADLYWLANEGHSMQAYQFPTPEEGLFELGPPAQVLHAFVHAVSANKTSWRHGSPDNLFAVAFFVEAWAEEFHRDPNDQDPAAAISKAKKGLLPKTHTGRIEQRTIIAADRLGNKYFGYQRRGETIVIDVTTPADTAIHQHTGTIPHSLSVLIAALASGTPQ